MTQYKQKTNSVSKGLLPIFILITLLIFTGLVLINNNKFKVNGATQIGKIVFAPFGVSPFQLFLINDDGTSLDTLYRSRNSRAVGGIPAFSRDGGWVAFDEDTDGNGPQLPKIKKINLSTKAATSVANGGHPDWSPDGSKIVYCNIANGQIWRMNNNGTNPTVVWGDSNYEFCDPEWSPDGTKVVFKGHRVSDPDIKASVFVININPDGTNPTNLRQLTNLNWQYSDHDPTWSPDSQWIAFSRYLGTGPWYLNSGSNWNSFKVDLNGTETQLTFADQNHLSSTPVVSPDGTEVIFFNTMTPLGNCPTPVYRMNSDGSNQRPLWGDPPNPVLCSIFYDWVQPSVVNANPTPTARNRNN